MTSSNVPVVWAQRKDQVLVKIDLQDVKDEDIKLEATKLHFTGKSAGKDYHCDLEFFGEIDPEKSKFAHRGREVEFVLVKKEAGPYWDRLLKDSGKPKWLKVDWDKWIDEDEVEEKDNFDMGGMDNFDMSSMMQGGMGGMEGMGGDFGEDDSDDDDVPGLEEEEPEKKEEKGAQ